MIGGEFDSYLVNVYNFGLLIRSVKVSKLYYLYIYEEIKENENIFFFGMSL